MLIFLIILFIKLMIEKKKYIYILEFFFLKKK